MTIRICPKRDAVCPHGMGCPYTIDRYTCKDEGASTLRTALAPPADVAGEVEAIRELTEAELLATKGYPDVGQLNAYYYSFEATGVPEIDAILGGVGSAGKGYHHTECWDEEQGSGEFQFSYIDRIQGAALLAAKKMATLLRLLSEERARRVEWQPIETAPREHGLEILVLCDFPKMQAVVFWLDAKNIMGEEETFVSGWYISDGHNDPIWFRANPYMTHWRLLPTPPATHKDTQDE